MKVYTDTIRLEDGNEMLVTVTDVDKRLFQLQMGGGTCKFNFTSHGAEQIKMAIDNVVSSFHS